MICFLQPPFQRGRLSFLQRVALPSAACIFAMALPAQASTLCVNPNSVPGCVTTISAAVAAALPGDTIRVAPGTYREDVVIPTSLSLIGEDRETTIIDATG